jgi:4-hydroxy-L-threonine phosphate dehydrogenase PdxA
VAEDVAISTEEHFTTLTVNFAIEHVSTNFVPQLLTAEQEDKCLNTCTHIFQQAEVEENSIKVIIMNDEM